MRLFPNTLTFSIADTSSHFSLCHTVTHSLSCRLPNCQFSRALHAHCFLTLIKLIHIGLLLLEKKNICTSPTFPPCEITVTKKEWNLLRNISVKKKTDFTVMCCFLGDRLDAAVLISCLPCGSLASCRTWAQKKIISRPPFAALTSVLAYICTFPTPAF